MKNFQDLDCVEVDRPVQCWEKYLFILLLCDIELLWHMGHMKWKWQVWFSISIIGLSVALLIYYVLAVISGGIYHWLQNVMLTKYLSAQKI